MLNSTETASINRTSQPCTSKCFLKRTSCSLRKICCHNSGFPLCCTPSAYILALVCVLDRTLCFSSTSLQISLYNFRQTWAVREAHLELDINTTNSKALQDNIQGVWAVWETPNSLEPSAQPSRNLGWHSFFGTYLHSCWGALCKTCSGLPTHFSSSLQSQQISVGKSHLQSVILPLLPLHSSVSVAEHQHLTQQTQCNAHTTLMRQKVEVNHQFSTTIAFYRIYRIERNLGVDKTSLICMGRLKEVHCCTIHHLHSCIWVYSDIPMYQHIHTCSWASTRVQIQCKIFTKQ